MFNNYLLYKLKKISASVKALIIVGKMNYSILDKIIFITMKNKSPLIETIKSRTRNVSECENSFIIAA